MIKRVVLVLVWLLTLLGNGSVFSEPKRDAINTLLERTDYARGIQFTVEQLQYEVVKERIISPAVALDKDEKELFFAALKKEAIQLMLVDALDAALSDMDVEYLVKYYSDDLMDSNLKRIREFSTPEGQEKAKALYMKALNEIPDRNRIQLIQGLVDAQLAVPQKVFLFSAVYKARLFAPIEADRKLTEEDKQKLNFNMSKYKDNLQVSFQHESLINNYFLYDGLTNEEIRDLTVKYEDEKRMKFQMVVTEALANALERGVSSGIKAIGKYRKAKGA